MAKKELRLGVGASRRLLGSGWKKRDAALQAERQAVMRATLATAARVYLVYVHDGVTPESIAKLSELAAAQRLLKAMDVNVLNRAELEEVSRG